MGLVAAVGDSLLGHQTVPPLVVAVAGWTAHGCQIGYLKPLLTMMAVKKKLMVHFDSLETAGHAVAAAAEAPNVMLAVD